MIVNQLLPGESHYSKTQKLWNDANKAVRQRLLTQSGQDKNRHYALAFNYLPSWVREALVAKHKESQQLSNPRLATKRTAANHARV